MKRRMLFAVLAALVLLLATAAAVSAETGDAGQTGGSGQPAATGSVTIRYEYEDGSEVFPEETISGTVGSGYYHLIPTKPGYYTKIGEIEYVAVTGTYEEGNKTVTVTYYRGQIPFTVTFLDGDSETYDRITSVTLGFYIGDTYDVDLAQYVEGFTPDQPRLTGTITAEGNYNYYITCTRNSYPLTIHYVYEDGTTVFRSYTRQVLFEEHYLEDSPYLEGYTPDPTYVEGNMGAEGATYTIVYRPEEPARTPDGGIPVWPFAVGGGVLVLAGAGTGVLLYRRRSRKS